MQPFENYASGDELFDSLDKEHDLLDRDLRLWVEECDQMQGVQVFTGSDDAWGGFASRYVERLRDEYGKVGIWVWGIDGWHQGGGKVRPLFHLVTRQGFRTCFLGIICTLTLLMWNCTGQEIA